MRVLVIGVDALELTLARKLGIFELDYTYTYRIPKELWYNGEPHTPLVWTAYVTGKNPSEVGVKEVVEVPKWIRILKKIVNATPLRRIKGKGRVLKAVGIQVAKPFRIKGDTLFDDVHGSIPINYPGINLREYFYRTLDLLAKGKYKDAVREVFEGSLNALKDTVNVLESEPSLVFTYFNVLDIVGHLYWEKNHRRVVNVYKMMWFHVRNVIEVAKRYGYGVVIVTDHGMQGSGDGVTGRHTDYAFLTTDIYGLGIRSPYELRSRLVGVVNE